MARKTITCTVGIYDTAYELTEHRDGSVTVRAPYVHWRNNSGILSFSRRHISTPQTCKKIKAMFADDEIARKNGETLDDLIY